MARNGLIKAVAYLRTSSQTNVGQDKDSEKRQTEAIRNFARFAGFEVVATYYDPGVSGADPIETRPGFIAMLDRIADNGVRTVIVEDASRFARDLVTQELGIIALIKLGVTVMTSSGDDLTNTTDPFKKAMRQIAGVFSELEKARLVHKLKVARDRKSADLGRKIDVRKTVDVVYPEATKRAKYLHRYKRMSLRGIAVMLATEGHTTRGKGTPFNPKMVKSMVEV
jgi:DNA invertase Pin-like site-specific DNA recombinase